MKDVLSEIVLNKKKEVASLKEQVSLSELEKQLLQKKDILKFRSLKDALLNSRTGIIAEFKRRSPSKGWLHQNADVIAVTKAYENAGASALSVLTDENYFGGTLADLNRAVKNVQIPVMRKEFIVDEYQIFEAKLSGASAILLIAAAITKEESKRFTKLANELQIDVLLELHDESEVDYITPLNSLIGVNNRNLGSFVTDLQKSFRMAKLLPADSVWVSESGISDANVVKELRNAGYKGFLIGEYFMKSGNSEESLKEFILQIAGN
jgi:indole-3-glycerol phosphate synthase